MSRTMTIHGILRVVAVVAVVIVIVILGGNNSDIQYHELWYVSISVSLKKK